MTSLEYLKHHGQIWRVSISLPTSSSGYSEGYHVLKRVSPSTTLSTFRVALGPAIMTEGVLGDVGDVDCDTEPIMGVPLLLSLSHPGTAA